jgi:protein-disulfide isomerase
MSNFTSMRSDPGAERSPHSSRFTRLLVVALIVAVGVLVLALLAPRGSGVAGSSSSSGGPAAGDSSASEQGLASLAERRDGDPLALGPVDAPVVMIEWSDYRCPFCAVFANDSLHEIREEYVDTGQVRFEFRDLAIFGDQSIDAAVAARAAGEQGRYFEFAEALFAAAPEKGHPDLPEEALVGFAEAASVPDLARFERDLDDPRLRALVEADTARAQQLGATGTPFFLVGGTPLSGAQPVEVFSRVIEAELATAATS